ncbi:MAG: hypothetical protein KAH32_04090 [Chlamydiia bacterium]|nr:hypothetical protein [Chlamydiia bacterium]
MKIRNFKMPLSYIIGMMSVMSANVVSDPITMDAVIIGKDASSIGDMSAVCNDDTLLSAYTCACLSSTSLRPIRKSMSDALALGEVGVGVSYCFRSCGSKIIKADLKRMYTRPCKLGVRHSDNYSTDMFVGMGITDCFSCCGSGGFVNSIMLCASYKNKHKNEFYNEIKNTISTKENTTSILLMVSGYNCCYYKNFTEFRCFIGPSKTSGTGSGEIMVAESYEPMFPSKLFKINEIIKPTGHRYDTSHGYLGAKIGFGVSVARRVIDGYCVFVDLDADGVYGFSAGGYVPSFKEGKVIAKIGMMYAI